MSPSYQRLRKDLEALADAPNALAALDAGRRLRERAEEIERDLVLAARTAGVSWAKIGKLYGMSKQGAQQRFRDATLDRPTDSAAASPTVPSAEKAAEPKASAT